MEVAETREGILDEAIKVTSTRATQHGSFTNNMDHQSLLVEAFMKTARDNPNLPPMDSGFWSCMFHTLSKISRIACGAYNVDDFVDGANYFAKGGELLGEHTHPVIPK